jgi:hypothetical protein
MAANLNQALVDGVTKALEVNEGHRTPADVLQFLVGWLGADHPMAARALYQVAQMDPLAAIPGPLGSKFAKHLYEVEVDGPGKKIEVHADGRAKAATLAELSGYVVRSVNMVG